MTNEIDRSSYRLEVAAKLDRLACDLQTANAAIIGYASSLLGGDAFGRPRDHQPHTKGHRQGTALFHRPLLPEEAE